MKVVLKIPKPANAKWTVKGATIEELFNNLNKHKWWGRYRAHPTYAYKEKNSVVTEFTLKAKPEIIMPAWAKYSKASKDEKKSWDDMWKALKKHEEHHHKIFETETTAWKKAMDKLGDIDAKAAKSEWDKFGKSTQGKQDGYDRKTAHGENEGVVLNVV